MTAVNLKLQLLKAVQGTEKPGALINSATTIILAGSYHITTASTVNLSEDIPAGSRIQITKPYNVIITLSCLGLEVFEFEGEEDPVLIHNTNRELKLYKGNDGKWSIYL